MASKSTTSTAKRKTVKHEKPHRDFALFPHQAGVWAKKIKGRLHYFGSIKDDPQGTKAIARYDRERGYLEQGQTPPPPDIEGGCTLRALCNRFLESKRLKCDAGELSLRSYKDYRAITDLLIAHFGKDRMVADLRPDDFQKLRAKLAKRLGVVSLGNTINRCKIVFKFAHVNELIDRPVRYGQGFARPSAITMRKARHAAGAKLFSRDELLLILKALEGKPVKVDDEKLKLKPDPVLKAMVLLGINCGFGNTDCATLPQAAVDLDKGWIDYPRPKTAVQRRIPLWPETTAALRRAIAVRPRPADGKDAGLCFLTRQGRPWMRVQAQTEGEDIKAVVIDPLGQRFIKLLRRLHINGRKGLGFYVLRHCFETHAGESRDQVAVNAIMGHVDTTMAGVYREKISDDRLQAVTNTVRTWLLG